MTAIDSGLRPGVRPSRFFSRFRLQRWLVRWRQQRRAARDHIMLSGLDEHLLYDLGLDPLDLHEALKARQLPSMLLDDMRRQLATRNGKPRQ